MVNYKPIAVPLLFLLLMSCFPASAQQVPTITPKPQPIILKLDEAGNHINKIEELATISKSTNDSANRTILTPKRFDCSTTGKQVVNVKAINNGFKGNLNPNDVQLQYPIGLAFDRAGNFYIVQNEGYTIQKVTQKGEVSTYAGTGVQGYSNGPRATAMFDSMLDIVIDSADNLYITDSFSRIRKITPDGMVSTFAGKGIPGDGDDQGEKAIFNHPKCLAIDKDQNIYVGDTENFKIRKITPTGLVTTLAGDGREGNFIGNGKTARFGDIQGLVTDADNNVYVCDAKYHQIKKITPDGTVSVYAGNGNAGNADGDRLSATIQQPFSMVFDESGNLYFADLFTIRKITPDGKVVTVAGDNNQPPGNTDGYGTDARFTICECMRLDPCGNIYVADFDNRVIRKITHDNYVTTIAGNGPYFKYTGNVGPSTCATSTLNIPVNVQSQPTITSVFDNVTVTDCATMANYAIKAAATDNCPASTIRFTQTPDANTLLQNHVPLKVTLTATDNTGGTNSITFNVTAQNDVEPPGRSVKVSASSTSSCEGSPIKFIADVKNPDAGTSYQWLVNGVNSGLNSPEFVSSTLKTGDFVNCAVTTGGGCGIPNLGFDVPVVVNPYPVITLNPAEQIIAGKSIQLNPIVSGNIATYNWIPTDGLSDSHSQYPVASPDNTTTYKLTATSVDGCPAESMVKVTVIHNITPPNTFSPNGDGQNDTWNITGLDSYPVSTTQVFNRYGSAVFKSTGYPKPWDGSINGQDVPGGTYYYIIDLKNGTLLKGWLLIAR
jgi:gliding motility-associated-like protein